MKKAMLSRLSALEVGGPDGLMPCIVIQFVAPREGVKEPTAYRDGNGGRWEREPGETFDEFQDRAVAGAREGASPRCGSYILPDDGRGEA